ncbi:MAG TPA: hypothetical protein VGO47_08025 [Chlamydiales bacterium]|jgi:hypothetical protein|nr:hypothetical protein [Chlamydiales bacterium]
MAHIFGLKAPPRVFLIQLSSPNMPSTSSARHPRSSSQLEAIISGLKKHAKATRLKRYVYFLIYAVQQRLWVFFPSDEPLAVFHRAARWFPVAVSPFVMLKRVIYAGLPVVQEGENAGDEESEEEEEE